MRITVIPDDQFVSVDGVGRSGLSFDCPDGVHAFQWYGNYGEIEYKANVEGGTLVKPQNQIVASFDEFQAALDAWAAPPPEPPPLPPPTEADFAAAIQGHIDATAQAKGYTDGFALAGYVASTVQEWAAEATAFVAWRDSVWLYAYQEMAKVAAGERPTPTVLELIGELPAIAWPNQAA